MRGKERNALHSFAQHYSNGCDVTVCNKAHYETFLVLYCIHKYCVMLTGQSSETRRLMADISLSEFCVSFSLTAISHRVMT